MRYFKYENARKCIDNTLKEQYLTLIRDEKSAFDKEKFWRRVSSIASLIIFFFCVFASVYLLYIIPNPSNEWLEVFVLICKVLAGVILFIISGFVTALITSPLWKKADSYNIPLMKKEICSKACEHLRNYYGLEEPYIVTKCYDSTDKKFTNHDVCLFISNDELRITTDLVQGFLYGERDLGCYAFKQYEITLSKKQDHKLLIAELKVGNNVFLLGYRAKRFIEQSFISGTKC